ncbi:hypothetical protein PENSPDRAFT_733597 [Peniophora sp. CONT]|nr:hypothetical protein PENSPDRAFT_733597 [Peniophora sp. CONT]
MAARAVLSKQLRQVADAWAPDPMFAPQFKTFLTSLSEHPNLTREAVDAARALQDNRILQKVPTPEKIMKPAGRPEHYKRVAEGYERALEGKKRPYWKIFFNIW